MVDSYCMKTSGFTVPDSVTVLTLIRSVERLTHFSDEVRIE